MGNGFSGAPSKPSSAWESRTLVARKIHLPKSLYEPSNGTSMLWVDEEGKFPIPVPRQRPVAIVGPLGPRAVSSGEAGFCIRHAIIEQDMAIFWARPRFGICLQGPYSERSFGFATPSPPLPHACAPWERGLAHQAFRNLEVGALPCLIWSFVDSCVILRKANSLLKLQRVHSLSHVGCHKHAPDPLGSHDARMKGMGRSRLLGVSLNSSARP